MERIRIDKGNEMIEFERVTNLEEVKQRAIEIVEKYDGLIIADNNIKEYKEVIAELKLPREQVAKYRSATNKIVQAKLAEKLKEIDDIKAIFTKAINPLQLKVDDYTNEKKDRKYKEKKAKFQDEIDERNKELEEIAKQLIYFEFTPLEFSREWSNKKDVSISAELCRSVDILRNQIKRKIERLDNIKTNCKLLKADYDLAGDINWRQLREKMYEDEWKELLEDIASVQQEQELAAVEKAEEVRNIQEEIIIKNKEININNTKLTLEFDITKSDAIELKNWLENKGITYKKL